MLCTSFRVIFALHLQSSSAETSRSYRGKIMKDHALVKK
jgi:hypothetical protein